MMSKQQNIEAVIALAGKKTMPFDDWLKLKKYTQLSPNLYKKGETSIDHKGIFKQYLSEQLV